MPPGDDSVGSEFEAISTAEMVALSDGSLVRVLCVNASGAAADLTCLFVGGWGSVVAGWDPITLELTKYFNVVYLETREKRSSVLSNHEQHDVDRASKDVGEVVRHLGLDEKTLVVVGSSWGSVLVANALARRDFDALLAVFLAPIARVRVPFFTRYLVSHLPTRVIVSLRPLVKFWLTRFRSKNDHQTGIYLRILEEADPQKWIQVGRHIFDRTYWHLYPKIEADVLVVAAESEDTFHPSGEVRQIRKLIASSTVVFVPTTADLDSSSVVDVICQHLAAGPRSTTHECSP